MCADRRRVPRSDRAPETRVSLGSLARASILGCLRHRSRMNSTTDSHRIDEARDAYVEWLELSIAVQDAYVRWRHRPRREAAVSFAAYTSALDLEERSALEYAELVAGPSR
jgi:hypothetical protein